MARRGHPCTQMERELVNTMGNPGERIELTIASTSFYACWRRWPRQPRSSPCWKLTKRWLSGELQSELDGTISVPSSKQHSLLTILLTSLLACFADHYKHTSLGPLILSTPLEAYPLSLEDYVGQFGAVIDLHCPCADVGWMSSTHVLVVYIQIDWSCICLNSIFMSFLERLWSILWWHVSLFFGRRIMSLQEV